MTGRKYGYARVSSNSQNLDRQIIALKEYVEDTNIIVDKKSGKNLEREGYQALKGPMGLRRETHCMWFPWTDSAGANRIFCRR